MLELPEFIMQSIEYQGFGLNALTVGTIGTSLVLPLELYGLRQQAKTIWRKQSGDTVSVYFFSYFAFFLAACILYGIAIKSLAIIIGALLPFLLHFPILWGIYKFKGWTKKEIVSTLLFSLMPIAMIFSPSMDTTYLIVSAGVIYAFGMQARELWQEKKTGAVDIKLLLIYLVTTIFWIIYAFAIQAFALMVLNPIIFIILIVMILLWHHYKKQEEQKEAIA